ncbi:MAG TPA: helix-turn-helix domain-containing protein [Streptosporangiaceae bacterium]|nr:helix-turn-helix domain-containing protein [Streptosporangiaceae bacterium]
MTVLPVAPYRGHDQASARCVLHRALVSDARRAAEPWFLNADGFASLYPKYKGGRPPKFTLGQRREVKKAAKSHPCGPRPAVLDLEPVQAGGVPGR